MKIAVGCDHGALELKNAVVKYLESKGHEVKDFGTYTTDSCDYPDFAYPAAKALANGEVERTIVMCTTGIGVSMVANKVNGVRCSLVQNVEDTILTRKHNNSNCLALGARDVTIAKAFEIINAWLETEFEGGRHLRRVEKIKEVEEKEKHE